MTNRVNADGTSDRAATESAPETSPGTETVEAYEDDGDIVFYDAENPLAWIQADTTVPITDAA